MYQVYKITVAPGISYDCIADSAMDLRCSDKVIIKCEKYQEYATISECRYIEPFENIEEFEEKRSRQNKGRHIEGQRMPQVLRRATLEDIQQAKANETKADEAYVKTMECIKKHNLDMKLILSHYAFDGKMLIFQFLAEGRIDFRELLRDLSSIFHIRVELRQVGVRDEASILGGIGTCGRELCCACFLHSIASVNVKMAKQQGLSLNPQSISGCCGRLKCCLQYESDEYSKEGQKEKEKEKKQTVPDYSQPSSEISQQPVENIQQGIDSSAKRPQSNNSQSSSEAREKNNSSRHFGQRPDNPQNRQRPNGNENKKGHAPGNNPGNTQNTGKGGKPFHPQQPHHPKPHNHPPRNGESHGGPRQKEEGGHKPNESRPQQPPAQPSSGAVFLNE